MKSSTSTATSYGTLSSQQHKGSAASLKETTINHIPEIHINTQHSDLNEQCSPNMLLKLNPRTDAEFQPENEISQEVRKMLLDWESAQSSSIVKSAPISHGQNRMAAGVVDWAWLNQPPQRYRRTTKRAHARNHNFEANKG